MADFKQFFPTLIKHEGGFVNHPSDPGGATNLGVTLGTFKLYAQSLLKIAPTLDNLKRLTKDQAAVIYKAKYWDPLGLDFIGHQWLANIVFDFYVNAGGNAVTVLQVVLAGMGIAVSIDGKLGPGTRNALVTGDSRDPVNLYRRYKQARINYYKNLAAKRPSMRVFLKGWLNRVNAFPNL